MSRYETEDEQLEQLKSWWKKNGTQLLSVVLVATVAYSGWTYYSNSKYVASANASATFEILQNQYNNGTFSEVSREALKLMQEQPESPYAISAALLYAKYSYDKGEYESAIEQLDWVQTHTQDAELKAIAQMRRAETQLQMGNSELALESLQSISTPQLGQAIQAQVDYKIGVVALTLTQLDAARSAFEKVVNNAQVDESLKGLAQLQLNDLTS